MENLHTDMVENILLRLPLGTALLAKRVCKTWRILLRVKTDKVGLLLAATYSHDRKKNKLIYGDQFDDIRGKITNYSNSYDSLAKLHGDEVIRGYEYMDGMIGSCNGLVCFERQRKYHSGGPFLICNPFTGEVAYVHKPNSSIASCGFGYCHSTNKYKIVKMDYQLKGSYRYRVQVYTIGAGDEWRTKGYINMSPVDPEGIYANGALHWLHRNKYKQHGNYSIEDYTVIAFDLEEEKFQIIPLPPFKDVKYQRWPKLLGGNNLYLVYTTYDKPFRTDIWSYKRINTNTSDGCDMKASYDDKNSWHWIKEFSIEWEEPYWKDRMYFEPLAITGKDGVLLRKGFNSLYYYDLKTSTLNKLFDGSAIGCHTINVIPHANNIVSMSSKEREDGQDPQ